MDGLNDNIINANIDARRHVYIGFYFNLGCVPQLARVFRYNDQAWKKRSQNDAEIVVREVLTEQNAVVTKTIDRLMQRRGLDFDERHTVMTQCIKYCYQRESFIKFVPDDKGRLRRTLANLKNEDRVVIVGHADVSRFMWGRAPEVLVNFLSKDLKPNADCKISLYCCYAGQESEKSLGWAVDFYTQMCMQNTQIYSVAARTGKLAVQSNGRKTITTPFNIDYYKVELHNIQFDADNELECDVNFSRQKPGGRNTLVQKP